MNTKIFPLANLALIPLLYGGAMCMSLSAMPLGIPSSLKVPDGQVLLLKAKARGKQIYQCQAKTDNPSQFEWALKAPQADLFNDLAQKIGRHYAGPTWEANDGSKVVGEVKARVKAPNSSAIPWLLLQVKSHTRNGTFSQVAYIQRVDTVAGMAPAQGCDQAHTGTQVGVNYEANYLFYSAAR